MTDRPPAAVPWEQALRRAGTTDPRWLGRGPDPDPGRTARGRLDLLAATVAPRPGRLGSTLRRLGVDEATARLLTATPALRRSWLGAVALALLFALSAAGTSTASGADRIVVFLTAAPLVPLLGVAFAYGAGVDPTHDTVVVAPLDAFRVFAVRVVAVLGTSIAVLVPASALVPEGGAARLAWLLPALAVTVATALLAGRVGTRRAATAVATAWLALVWAAALALDRPAAAFDGAGQALSLAVAVLGLAALRRRRWWAAP